MKNYEVNNIRNIALGSHNGVGKTTLIEAILYTAGIINRMGSIENGNTVSDYQPAEIERKSSIQLSLINFEWGEKKINVLDTPGYADFVGEVACAAQVADSAVILISSQDGVEVGTEQVWSFFTTLPVAFFVNQIDKENSDWTKVLNELKETFGNGVTPLTIPIGTGSKFKGIIDLVSGKAYEYESGGKGRGKEIDIPADMEAQINSMRNELVENAAETNDALLEKYLTEGKLSDEEIFSGLKEGVINRMIFPVFVGSASLNIGTDLLIEAASNLLPSPIEITPQKQEAIKETEFAIPEPDAKSPFAGMVFKTLSEAHMGKVSFVKVYSGSLESGDDILNIPKNSTERISQLFTTNGKNRTEVSSVIAGDICATVKLKVTSTNDVLCDKSKQVKLPMVEFPKPVIDVAIETREKGDEEKIANGFSKLHEEDPTFDFRVDPDIKQTILEGQGELHLNLIVQKLKEQFGVDVELTKPKIPYRETIRKKSEAQGKYKKQTGGRGQYGDVWIRLEPLERGEGLVFSEEITGGVVPSKYFPSVEKGIVDAALKGILAGYKIVDMKAVLYDGSYHPVDSSDIAFQVAGSYGLKNAFDNADPYLLEPIYKVSVITPKDTMGDVMGDLTSRRGKILGMEGHGNFQRINSQVPLSELYKYSTALRSLTQGRGIHTREFSHYEEVPYEFAQRIIDESKKGEE
ncbi:elongation factor G [bacterium]|nr:elongation factor G [bacterium]